MEKQTEKIERTDRHSKTYYTQQLRKMFKNDDRFSEYCKEHRFNIVHIICSDHNEIICDACLVRFHSNCDTKELGYLTTETLSAWLEGVFKSISKLIGNLKGFDSRVKEHEKELKDSFDIEMRRLTALEKMIGGYMKTMFNNLRDVLEYKFNEMEQLRSHSLTKYKVIQDKLSDIKAYLKDIESGKSTKVIESNYDSFLKMKNQLDEYYSQCLFWFNSTRGVYTTNLSLASQTNTLLSITSTIKNISKELSLSELKEKLDNQINTMMITDPLYQLNVKYINQPIHPLENNIGMVFNLETECVRNEKISIWKIKPYSKICYIDNYMIVSGGLENDYATKSVSVYRGGSSISNNKILNKSHTQTGEIPIVRSNLEKSHTTVNPLKNKYNYQTYSSLSKFFTDQFLQHNYPSSFEIDSMRHPRAGHCFIYFNSMLIVISGVHTPTCEYFDSNNGGWSMMASLSSERVEANAIVFNQQFVLVFHGVDMNDNYYSRIDRFNLANLKENKWESIPFTSDKEIELERTNFGLLIDGENVLIIGGVDPMKKIMTSVIEYNVKKSEFTALDDHLIPVSFDFNGGFISYYKNSIGIDTNANIWSYCHLEKKFFLKQKYIN